MAQLDSTKGIDVRYAANLVRLSLTDDEMATFQHQLGEVLEYVKSLEGLDVSNVEPMAHTRPVFNVFREDAARPGFTQQQALANAPHSANGLFVVTKVVE